MPASYPLINFQTRILSLNLRYGVTMDQIEIRDIARVRAPRTSVDGEH